LTLILIIAKIITSTELTKKGRNGEMSIYLGNLSIDEIEARAGIKFPVLLREYMEPRRQHNASNIKQGQWHCFDLPFNLACGDMDTAVEIHKHLKDFSSNFREPLQISIHE